MIDGDTLNGSTEHGTKSMWDGSGSRVQMLVYVGATLPAAPSVLISLRSNDYFEDAKSRHFSMDAINKEREEGSAGNRVKGKGTM